MPAYLDACDVLVSPHVDLGGGVDFFGSPTKLFEYMASGKPIVASRLGQIGDVLVDGESAILVTPGDQHELVEALEVLLDDRVAARQLWSGRPPSRSSAPYLARERRAGDQPVRQSPQPGAYVDTFETLTRGLSRLACTRLSITSTAFFPITRLNQDAYLFVVHVREMLSPAAPRVRDWRGRLSH